MEGGERWKEGRDGRREDGWGNGSERRRERKIPEFSISLSMMAASMICFSDLPLHDSGT